MKISDFQLVHELIEAELTLYTRMNNHPNDKPRREAARKDYRDEIIRLTEYCEKDDD